MEKRIEVPANNPIYEALLEKVAEYSRAAETILAYNKNIYNEYATYISFEKRPQQISNEVEEYIYNFIKNQLYPPSTSSNA